METFTQTFKTTGLSTFGSNDALLQNFARPIEAYRTCMVKILSEILECEEQVIQKCVLWPNNIDNGDLTVVLPKLRPGVKANETAVEIIEKVRTTQSRYDSFNANSLTRDSSLRIIPCFPDPFEMLYNFGSLQNLPT